MVERSIAWLTRNRRLRYRGTTKNDHWLTRVAAINLRRLINLGLAHNGHMALLTNHHTQAQTNHYSRIPAISCITVNPDCRPPIDAQPSETRCSAHS